MNFESTSNCGTYELNGVREFSISRPRPFFTDLHSACETMFDRSGRLYDIKKWRIPGIILFSDAKGRGMSRPTKGEVFAQFIEDNGLGTVSSGEWTKNPNTGNKIKFWTWNVNEAALRRFG